MPLTKIDDRGLTTPVDLLDNEKIRLGTGNDLQLYHDGTHSFVEDAGTGQLRLCGDNGVVIRKGPYSDVMINAIADGAVQLYHDGALKAETRSDGFEIKQHLTMGDSDEIRLGNSSDLKIYHDGSHSYVAHNGTGALRVRGDLVQITDIAGGGGGDSMATFTSGGAVQLYYNNVKRFETKSDGARFTGHLYSNDNEKLRLGTGHDLEIYHNGTHSYIDNDTGIFHIRNNTGTYNGSSILIQALADENAIGANPNGAVTLYFDNSPKLATDATGANVTGNFALTGELNMTTGGNYNRFIDCSLDDNEALFIRSTNGGDANHQYMALFHRQGAVELYHAAAKKFETHTNGVRVQDLASASAYLFLTTNAGNQGSLYGTANTLGLLDSQNHYMIKAIKDAGVELYNDNEKKFATGSNGVYLDHNGTLHENAIHFETAQNNNDYATLFGVTNYPDNSGFSGQGVGHWARIQSKGGCVVIINTDASNRNDARNGFDHFSVYQRAGESTNGKRLFSVDGEGSAQFGRAGIRIDNSWGAQPSFTVQRNNNDGTDNTNDNAYLRVHGIGQTHESWTGGAVGADFSANFLIDGDTYGTSDRRAKTDIVDCPYGLDIVNKLQPRKFQLVNSALVPQGPDNINLGFIAQEIKEHIPECVNYLGDEANIPNEKGWARAYALSMNEVVPVLTKAIQELSDKVKTLETKVAALEAK